MEAERVRRAVPLMLAWAVAAIGAMFLASQAVTLVGREVTDQRPAALSADEIDHRLDDIESSSSTSSTTPSSTTTAPDTSTSIPPASTPTTAAPQPPPSTGGPTSAPIAAAGPTTTTPAAPTGPQPAPAATRTYSLVGGSVSLRFASTGVSVVYATPAAGFEVDVEPEHGNGVKVEFRSDDHRSRVDGWWESGPVDRVREEAD